MRFIKLTWLGASNRPIHINIDDISNFFWNDAATDKSAHYTSLTMKSGKEIAVSEKPEHIMLMIAAIEAMENQDETVY